MKSSLIGLVSILMVWWVGDVSASELVIINPSICKDVDNHQPVDAGEAFGADVHKLFCYTRVVGPYHVEKEQYVVHVWYYGEEERARVKLPVKSSNWGTYSSKIIRPLETGPWRVDVIDPYDEVIITLPFSIEPIS